MQTLTSKLDGPWTRAPNVKAPYKWMSPTEIEMQDLAEEADRHMESLLNDDEIDEKINTIEAEQQAVARRAVQARGSRMGDPTMLPEASTELQRTRVQLSSADYHELGGGALTRVETDWLARYDQMKSQDARSLKVQADLRKLEARREALEIRRETELREMEARRIRLQSEEVEALDLGGPELGYRRVPSTFTERIQQLSPVERAALRRRARR